MRRALAARAMSSLVRPSRQKLLDLRKGHPIVAELPHAAIARACTAAAADLAAKGEAGVALNYAPSEGLRSHLDILAGWLSRKYGSPVRSDWLLTTNGVSHGLDLCAGALTRAGDEVVMESPTYFLAAQIFKDRGLRVRSAPVDGGGLDVDALEKALRSGATAPRAAYVVPRHGNPSGCTLSVARRRKLVALAEEFNFYVFCDDVYHLLDWSEARARRVLEYDAAYAAMDPSAPAADAAYDPAAVATSRGEEAAEDGSTRVVSVASFTKILSPGLRLGWIEAAPPVIAKLANLGYVVSGGGLAPFASEIGSRVIASGDLDAHLDGMCSDYAGRCGALLAALDAEPDVFELAARPTGGFFAWARLKGGVEAKELLAKCEGRVAFLCGGACDGGGAPISPWGTGADLGGHIRLCFAMNSAADLAEGVRRIARAARDLRRSH